MAGPGIEPRVITDQVRIVDVMPTVLDLTGIEIPAAVQGTTLRPALGGQPVDLLALSRNLVSEIPLRLERAHGGARRPVQVHLGAAARVVRPRRRSGREERHRGGRTRAWPTRSNAASASCRHDRHAAVAAAASRVSTRSGATPAGPGLRGSTVSVPRSRTSRAEIPRIRFASTTCCSAAKDSVAGRSTRPRQGAQALAADPDIIEAYTARQHAHQGGPGRRRRWPRTSGRSRWIPNTRARPGAWRWPTARGQGRGGRGRVRARPAAQSARRQAAVSARRHRDAQGRASRRRRGCWRRASRSTPTVPRSWSSSGGAHRDEAARRGRDGAHRGDCDQGRPGNGALQPGPGPGSPRQRGRRDRGVRGRDQGAARSCISRSSTWPSCSSGSGAPRMPRRTSALRWRRTPSSAPATCIWPRRCSMSATCLAPSRPPVKGLAAKPDPAIAPLGHFVLADVYAGMGRDADGGVRRRGAGRERRRPQTDRSKGPNGPATGPQTWRTRGRRQSRRQERRPTRRRAVDELDEELQSPRLRPAC